MSETPHIPFNTSANPRTEDLAKNTLYQTKNNTNKRKVQRKVVVVVVVATTITTGIIPWGYHTKGALQGNNGQIDRNMSESRRDKWQKIDRKLFKVTESWQKNVRIDSNLSKVTKICQYSVIYYVLIRTCFVNFDIGSL